MYCLLFILVRISRVVVGAGQLPMNFHDPTVKLYNTLAMHWKYISNRLLALCIAHLLCS